MALPISDLMQLLVRIRNERGIHANTANRVGTALIELLRYMSDATREEEVKALIRDFGRELFLSKVSEDTAASVITFLQGLKIGNWQAGDFTGRGGHIDAGGNATLNSLRLREWLEVPELRYNRAEVFVGTRWQTFGGGIIETVVSGGTGGAVTLKLEEGELGAVAVDDLCMGIWHDYSGGNAAADTDDRHGNFTFAGFKTVYFRITAVPATDLLGEDNSDHHYFEYALRSMAEGGNRVHPHYIRRSLFHSL